MNTVAPNMTHGDKAFCFSCPKLTNNFPLALKQSNSVIRIEDGFI